jgi:hypothetical protein
MDGLAFFLCTNTSWRVDLVTESDSHIQGCNSWASLDVFRHLLHESTGTVHDALQRFDRCVSVYINRQLTWPSVFMKTFSGIGAVLGTEIKTSVIFGLPIKYFDWAILWNAALVYRKQTRRELFPSWSWCGWIGPVSWGTPVGTIDTETMQMWCKSSHTWIEWKYWSIRTGNFEPLSNLMTPLYPNASSGGM